MSDQSENVNKKDLLQHIFSLAIPTFGQLIAEPAFVLVDTAIVGHLGKTQLAGLSIGSTVLLTTTGLCLFLAYNTTSQVARLLGAGKNRQGLSVGMDGLWLALVLGVVLTLVLMVFARPLCQSFGASGETLKNAIVYTQTVMPGLPAMLLGIATMIAQWYMGIVLTLPAIFWAAREKARLRPQAHSILKSAGIGGIPLFIRTLALRACMVATVAAAARLGTNTLAAYQVANSCWNFVMNILDAIGIAAQTIVASALGAGLLKRANVITKVCAQVGALSSVIVGIVMIFAGWLCSPLFSPNAEVQLLVSIGMTILGIFLPLSGFMWALDGVLIGAGDHKYLAKSCSITAVVYLLAISAVCVADVALFAGDITKTISLWVALNAVYIGGRALGNSLRVKTDDWMKCANL